MTLSDHMKAKYGNILKMQDNTIIFILCTIWSGIVAYGVANHKLNKQERINEIKDIVKLVYRLSSSAQAFWLSDGRNTIAESKLKDKLLRLTTEIQDVFSDRPEQRGKLLKKNITFRQEITGGTFENKDRPIETGRASNIQEMALDLIIDIKNIKKDIAKDWFTG